MKTIGFFAPHDSEELGSCAVRRHRTILGGAGGGDKSPAISRAGARDLRVLGQPCVAEPLRALLTDVDHVVRHEIARPRPQRVAAKLGLIRVAGSLSIARLRRRSCEDSKRLR